MTEQEKMAVFLDIHTDNLLEGPGDFASTQKAFSMLTDLPENPSILDIGCGPGRQTMDVSRLSTGTIMAIDNHAPFVETLQKRIHEQELADRMTAIQADMGDLQCAPRSFDIIWSEGAIYNIGFEHGLRLWQSFLKKGGYVVVSELSWLKTDAPETLQAFWHEEYPGMQSIEQNLTSVRKSGYHLVGHFTVPESSWWDYYGPIEKRIRMLRDKYTQNLEALDILDHEQQEIEFYRHYADYYGYVFYIGQLP